MAYNTPLQPHRPSHPLSRGELYRHIFVLIFSFSLPSCKPDIVQNGAAQKYFDLHGYFNADVVRLNKLSPAIIKTVTHNGISETKKVYINNWGLELNLFSSSDINKPAWRDNYTLKNNGDSVIYNAKTSDMKTQHIIIFKKGNTIKWLRIYNSTENLLYKTTEKLSYFPDSLYIIEKYQKVRLLGANNYTIRGTLN